MLPRLLANRSAANFQAGRHHDALGDAQHAVELAPSYAKASWRLAAAHKALKRPVDAALALAAFCRQSPAMAGPHAHALTRTIAHLSTHELAQGILSMLPSADTVRGKVPAHENSHAPFPFTSAAV